MKIPIYPIFYLLKGDYRPTNLEPNSAIEGKSWGNRGGARKSSYKCLNNLRHLGFRYKPLRFVSWPKALCFYPGPRTPRLVSSVTGKPKQVCLGNSDGAIFLHQHVLFGSVAVFLRHGPKIELP